MTMNKKHKWLPLKIISIVLFLMATVFLLWNAFATPYPWAIDSLQQKAVERATQEAINTARQEGDGGKPLPQRHRLYEAHAWQLLYRSKTRNPEQPYLGDSI